MAFKLALSKHDIQVKELAGGRRTPITYMVRGYVIQMTNPKAALAWIAIISLGLQEGAPFWVGVMIVVGTFVVSIVVHLTYAAAFSNQLLRCVYTGGRAV